ncbi:MAG: orotate phosphoribosyltransferase [Candidatus Omnitrophica bacterium]|nr:orotate phosphoribosyltransferase [Candidatus Omnitrophota bacterium]
MKIGPSGRKQVVGIMQYKVRFPMTKLEELKAKLLVLIRKEAIIKLPQPIKLSSGKMSDIYFDGRKVTLHPEGMTLFARAILELVDLNQIDAVGGPSIGADPIGTAVSLFAYHDKKKIVPAFLVRKEPKQYGLQKQIEGADLKPGMRILVVEDIVTTGTNVLTAISVIESFGAKVVQVVCLLDREEGGSAALKSYNLTPLFTRKEVES